MTPLVKCLHACVIQKHFPAQRILLRLKEVVSNMYNMQIRSFFCQIKALHYAAPDLQQCAEGFRKQHSLSMLLFLIDLYVTI